jgi:hypothetical protein
MDTMRRSLIALATAGSLLALVGGSLTAAEAANAPASQIYQYVIADMPPPIAGVAQTYGAQLQVNGKGVPGQTMDYQVRPAASKTFRTVASVVTDKDGNAQVSVALVYNSAVRWVHPASPQAAASHTYSAQTGVQVRVGMHIADTTLAPGQALIVHGATYPPKPGRRVTLYRGHNCLYAMIICPTPVVLATALIAPDGTFHLRYHFARPGRYHVYVAAPGGYRNIDGASSDHLVVMG